MDIHNKNVLEFDRVLLIVRGYYYRVVTSGTLVISHPKKKAWILALGRGTLETFQYISLFSKIDATSPLTIAP